jgi:hypothetical protein
MILFQYLGMFLYEGVFKRETRLKWWPTYVHKITVGSFVLENILLAIYTSLN